MLAGLLQRAFRRLIVAQSFVTMAKNTLDPRIALALIMESAIFMSKVDPKTVPQTAPGAK